MPIKLLAATLSACCVAIPVTFKADFRGRPVAPGGPHLAGSFQGWDPTATALADADADGIYAITLDLPAASYEFKFINGSSMEDAEALPPRCSVGGDEESYFYGYGNWNAHRIIHIAENATSAEVHFCFQECQPCDALALCKMFDCPPGRVLKESALDISGESRATCCEAVDRGKGSVVVRSAGYSDGNRAEFWLSGELLYATGDRGLTIVELKPNLIVNRRETFDTFLESSKLEGYLSSVAAGNLLLMGAVDEASAMLSPQAKTLIADCGAKSIQQMAFRSSYALIGQKSGSALSEVLLPEGSGTAVAVAQVVLPEPVPLLCKMYNCFWGALRYVLRADALETPGNSLEACCEAVGPGNHAVIVRSAGFSDGNEAEFWVNGELIYKTGTRGLTIVDLWPDMTVKHTETFDTYTDSSSLVAYLSSVAAGNMILVGAVDEASASFSQEAANLLRECGATFPQPISFRSSYALIGIKGGNALSEVVREEGAGYAVAVAEVSPPAPPSSCKMFNCPSGFVLRADAMEALGNSLEACCDAVGPGNHAVVVRSAGYEDGNEAEFWVNGELIYETSRRGLTVVDLWPDMTVKHTETFDTHIDSSSLVAYLSSVDKGSMILVGAADEASASISFEAANLLRECGATFPRPISWRSSYALIGIKGGEALSEVVRAQGDGYAVAVAEVSPPETTPPPPLPFCDMKVAEPPMSGVLAADGNLELDAGCRFRVWESPDMAQCLSGTWVVVTGSSNALLIFNTLLMLLAPAEADVQRRGRYGGAHLLDAVVEDGVLIYYETVRSSEASCIQSRAGGGSNETECRSIYSSSLQNAPPPNGRRIRVTMFLSFFWARTGTAVDLVEADRSWATAEVAMVVQVVAWYVVCNGIKFTGCPRSNLIDMEEAAVKAMFVTEMEAVLDRMAPFCEPGGRAGQRGCAVATNSWSDPGPTLTAMFQGYNSEVTKAMQPRKSSTFRLVDIFALGATMPGETYLGHGSQILHIWTWQALLGGFCAASSATHGRQMEFEGPVCWRKDASLDSCTAYTGTVLWQCMNSMLCVHRLLDKPTTSQITTTSSIDSFAPVDGGADRACRGAGAGDNSASYYNVISAASLLACKEECIRTEACVGIEYSGSRCEVWTRPEGIQASVHLAGFTCLSYASPLATTTTTTRMTATLFEAVDGGINRACRGASASDNAPANYVAISGVRNLGDCQIECTQVAACVGIEFSSGRCEVWIRPDGIQASVALSGFTCQRLLGATRRLDMDMTVFP